VRPEFFYKLVTNRKNSGWLERLRPVELTPLR
jgi:hypothetical protein